MFGSSLLRRARVILSEVSRSTEELRAIQAGNVGEVTLGITQNYGRYLVPTLLIELQASRPELRFDVVTGGFLER